MLIYSNHITPRLQYILGIFSNNLLKVSWELTNQTDRFRDSPGPKINYSDTRLGENEFWLKPHTLLFETGIRDQTVECFSGEDYKVFFKTEGDFFFDVFAASFYLLSRYEEYLPHKKDSYGRYAHENSLAYREGFLNQPLVNIWLGHFAKELEKKFPSLSHSHPAFLILPTYDIDIGWSYKHKGPWRSFGGLLRSLLTGDWDQLKSRINVHSGKRKDPFDSYGYLNRLHQKYNLKPYYFFLVAEKLSRYDRNISPRKKSMQALISDHVIRYPVGLHPSWQSGDNPQLLAEEKRILETICGQNILSSRQHYIRLTLPDTYRRLINAGIQFDFSMGYGSINGFRASVASPFPWYDLEQDVQTGLTLFPFCYMDANSFYEQHYSAMEALEEMLYFHETVSKVNGTFIMVWHNSFLGSEKMYSGWREVYEQFFEKISGG